MLWWILGSVVGGLIVLVALFALFATLVGKRQPVSHTVSRALRLNQSPETVWPVLADFEGQITWQPFLQSTRRLPDRDGKETWEMKYKGAGSPPMTLVVTESTPPRRLVRTIDDAKQVFSGRWEFDLTPVEGGCRLAITEFGTIPNPFFRGMWKLFSNPEQYLDQYLKALAVRFGEPAVIE
jgi:uncharacterized protein YndB with AHSA1/START domain